MKQVFANKGKVITELVPDKVLENGFVKVRTKYSSISMGTELTSVVSSGKSIFDRIKENPEYIKKGLNLLKEKGLNGTKDTLNNSLDRWNALGYSASGIVTEVSSDVIGFKPGDRVACAGGNYATHSEMMVVPKNLVVKIPDNVELRDASSVAIGAIAMQGVRRADVKLGEYVCVIGLGLIGQLTVQILMAAGVHVIAADIDDLRVNQTKKLGVENSINSAKEDVDTCIKSITGGMGVDAVIITAATRSSTPLKQAFKMCRKKGRVVLVGVVDINIDRSDMYEKELDFCISTSYGPGRYDSVYEEKGIDYPYHWVRFTENRNMSEYLSLISAGKIVLKQMYGEDVSIDDACKVYELLTNDTNRPLMQTFKYDEIYEKENSMSVSITREVARKGLKIALCGAGGFAKNFLLPSLHKISNCNIYAVMTRDGGNAKKVAQDFGACYAITSYDEIIENPEIDVVMISTRHDLHFDYLIKALNSGKDVYVEKPLCLNFDQLEQIKETVQKTNSGLMVGYNRRFSPHSMAIKEKIKNRVNPLIINYIMNAGYIPYDSWVHTEEGGGRIIGEACHIIDLFKYFTEENAISISVNDITPQTNYISNRDNIVFTIKYDKGSVATLTYCSNGNPGFQKETCHIFCDNKTIVLNDYRETLIYDIKTSKATTKGCDKGHLNELKAFTASCLKGERFVIPFEDLYETSKLSFLIDGLIKQWKC